MHFKTLFCKCLKRKMRLKSKLKNTGLKFLNINNVTDTDRVLTCTKKLSINSLQYFGKSKKPKNTKRISGLSWSLQVTKA